MEWAGCCYRGKHWEQPRNILYRTLRLFKDFPQEQHTSDWKVLTWFISSSQNNKTGHGRKAQSSRINNYILLFLFKEENDKTHKK